MSQDINRRDFMKSVAGASVVVGFSETGGTQPANDPHLTATLDSRWGSAWPTCLAG